MASGSEFYVKLNGIQLPAAEEKRIAAEVRATVLRELGRLDMTKSPQDSVAVRIPKEWLGLWIERIRSGGLLSNLPKTIGPSR